MVGSFDIVIGCEVLRISCLIPISLIKVNPRFCEVLNELVNLDLQLGVEEDVLLEPFLLEQIVKSQEGFLVNCTCLEHTNFIVSVFHPGKPLLHVFHDVEEAGQPDGSRKQPKQL